MSEGLAKDYLVLVKNERSGLNIFIFLLSFYFLFDLFSFILFLEPGLGLEVTRSCCHTAGYIR